MCMVLGLSGCGTDGSDDGDDDGGGGGIDAGGDSADPEGPQIVSFASNAPALHEVGDLLTISAVLTDPNGVDDIIGGQLFDIDAGTAYGAFATAAQEGAYSITLTWPQLVQTRGDLPGPWGKPVPLHLRGTFFDQAAHEASKDLTIDLACDVPEGRVAKVTVDGCVVGARCGEDLPEGVGIDSSAHCYLGATDAPTCNQACALLGTTCEHAEERVYDGHDVPAPVGCDAIPPFGTLCYCD